MQKLAGDLKFWRRFFDITQEQAADLFRVSITTYGRWERSVVAPNQKTEDRLYDLVAAMYFAHDQTKDGIAG